MRLRTQLVLAFFLLAVVPLTGLTLYSYYSSISAFKRVVKSESAVLAEDMGKRMELATLDLNRKVERLGSLPFMNFVDVNDSEAADAARLYARLVNELGDSASCVESFEFQPVHGGRPSRRESAAPPLPPPPPIPEAVMIYMHPDEEEVAPDGTQIVADMEVRVPESELPELRVARTRANRIVVQRLQDGRKPVVLAAPVGKVAGMAADEELKKLEESSRELEVQAGKVAEAVNLGKDIVRGELEKLAGVSRTLAAHQERIKVVLDTDFNCSVQSAGETVGTVRANVNAQALLHNVLMRTQKEKGEIPFAVDSDGKVYTPDPAGMKDLEGLRVSVAGLGSGATPEESRDWVVVTRKEPRFGLTFGIARPVGEAVQEIRNTAVRNLGYGLAMICVALLGILPLSRRMTRNLTALAEGAERLAAGDLDVEVPARSRDEFGRLAATFNRMARDLKKQQKDLVEQERIKKELEMSRHIQEEMLPRFPLRLPFAEVKGVSIPAREVGGDFFNYFALPDDRVAIVIGDVSGKGVAAALLMANVQATLRARLSVARDLSRLAAELDQEIYDQTPPETYLTLFMAILDSSRRSLTWVNAGHTPQFALQEKGEFVMLPATGRPLGLIPGGAYETGELRLYAGDSLFLYTDGLIDAEDSEGNEFGLSRVEAVLAAAVGSDPESLLARMEEARLGHQGSAEAADDATMMVLKVAGL